MWKEFKTAMKSITPRQFLAVYSGIRCPEHRPMKMTLGDHYIYKDQEGADEIYKTLATGKPCLIARFGWNEIYTVMLYLKQAQKPRITFNPRITRQMSEGAGFFPPTGEKLCRFASESIELIPDIDVLGVTGQRGEDYLIHTYNPKIKAVEISCICDHATLFERPWLRVLKGKKVLVIHPFAEIICSQYAKRELLFPGGRAELVLPVFELKTLKCVQSNGLNANHQPFEDWFAARDFMYEQIAKIDFDVALIGAGAYGMFLAHFCKKMEKQAIHIGGASQLIFGIRGRRWEQETPELAKQLFNEHWIRPGKNEQVDGFTTIEQGAYW